ncbi:MAG: hypothetical protein HUU46_09750 [Candidatus Hydrogenedentes bacterium]|nr:hypothetical protein [Candidatus Hydrogenedentota bacterium]
MYTEDQRFALWVYLVAIAVTCISLAGLVIAANTPNANPVPIATVIVVAVLCAFLWDVLVLRTTVSRDGVYVRLGWPIPIFWTRIGAGRIREARVVTYRPLLDAGGWGLRFGRFDGRFATFWNARGNRGVMIETDSRRYVIGSQSPELLHAAIELVRNRGA